MFYDYSTLVRKSSPLSLIWRIVTDKRFKPTRKAILSIDLNKICKDLLDTIPHQGKHSRIPYSLYLLAQLSYGTVLVHQKQGDLLYNDVRELRLLLATCSFIKPCGEHEKGAQKQRGKKRRVEKAGMELDQHMLQMFNESEVPVTSFEAMDEAAFGAALMKICRRNDYTLTEDISIPRDEFEFHDDFGPLTGEQRNFAEMLFDDADGTVATVVPRSGSDAVKECEEKSSILSTKRTIPLDENQSSPVQEKQQIMDTSSHSKAREYDLNGTYEPVQRLVVDYLGFEKENLENEHYEAPRKRRRKVMDEKTQIPTSEMRMNIANYEDTLCQRADRFPKYDKNFKSAAELLEPTPLMLRANAKLCTQLAMKCKVLKPLSLEIALAGGPLENLVQKVPQPIQGNSSIDAASSVRSIEQMRQTVTTSGLKSSTAEQSSTLKSDVFLSERSFEPKSSFAQLQHSSEETAASTKATERSYAIETEKARIHGLQNSLDSLKLGNDRVQGLAEKISLYDLRLLKDVTSSSSAKQSGGTLSSSCKVFSYQQRPEELFKLIKDNLESRKAASVTFSELFRESTRAVAAKGMSNLLNLLKDGKVNVKQEECYGEMVISLRE